MKQQNLEFLDKTLDMPLDVTSTIKSSFTRCFENHNPLPIGDNFIYGGNCANPVIKDADIYIGLDASHKRTERSLPWANNPIVEAYYPIKDMCAPTDLESFNKMLMWLCNQLQLGKKIHIGCIGGHGRTGLVLSALVYIVTGEINAIEFVRKNYCAKAVETEEQVDFLVKNYGIKKVECHKDYNHNSIVNVSSSYPIEQAYFSGGPIRTTKKKQVTKPTINAVPSKRTIW